MTTSTRTPQQTAAIDAIHQLNAMAADFKMGVVDNEYIRLCVFRAFSGLGLEQDSISAEVVQSMTYWGEWPEENEETS